MNRMTDDESPWSDPMAMAVSLALALALAMTLANGFYRKVRF